MPWKFYFKYGRWGGLSDKVSSRLRLEGRRGAYPGGIRDKKVFQISRGGKLWYVLENTIRLVCLELSWVREDEEERLLKAVGAMEELGFDSKGTGKWLRVLNKGMIF